jgi:MoaA/NifB/PqqE/SkfB family radical SAM enzyme
MTGLSSPGGRMEHVEWTPARIANRERNLAEFERRATRLESLPRVLFLELTENCNLSCPMCRSAGPYQRSRNMSEELFERIALELFPTAEIVDLRGWGESTILKRFPYFVDRTLEHGVRIRLVTNLTVPNEQMWRRLVRSGALIAVSFDAGEPETFARVRRGARLDRVLRNLDVMVDEAHASGMGTDNMHLNVIVQPASLPELTVIAGHAARLGVRMHLNPIILDEGHPDRLMYHRADVVHALADLAAFADENAVDIQLNAALDSVWADEGTADKTCTHPWMYLYVNYQGEVGFCDHLIGPGAARHLLGDLGTSTFQEIWNGPEYRNLRAQHGAGREAIDEGYEECRWCYRNRYLDFDHHSYPAYEKYRTPLTPALCASFTPGPPLSPPRRRSLPLTVAEHGLEACLEEQR